MKQRLRSIIHEKKPLRYGIMEGIFWIHFPTLEHKKKMTYSGCELKVFDALIQRIQLELLLNLGPQYQIPDLTHSIDDTFERERTPLDHYLKSSTLALYFHELNHEAIVEVFYLIRVFSSLNLEQCEVIHDQSPHEA